ncbi:MAG: hypothetical protein CVT90_01070 [Candidatus Altiarchaeales archaeon HGW-Altiarchaeales-3]|nr:MAG: hypothetical protein CVT90_01070 [Candidatus Altiarchaeales archaeon HGW-Altiarchaeales-3]
MNELTINLGLPEEISGICCKSISLETRDLERSKVDISYTKNGLCIYITALDLNALRGALNTYVRWIIMCCELTD